MARLLWLIPLTAITFGVYSYWTQPHISSRTMTESVSRPETATLENSAEVLTAASQTELEAVALNVDMQGDKRAEAIEKLSQSPDDHSLQTLTKLAARTLPKSGGGLFVAQERVFAAMAIEGILNHPSKDQQLKSLQAILKSQSDQFIVTRANMAMGFIKGITPHPKVVDEKNLNNLFE